MSEGEFDLDIEKWACADGSIRQGKRDKAHCMLARQFAIEFMMQ